VSYPHVFFGCSLGTPAKKKEKEKKKKRHFTIQAADLS